MYFCLSMENDVFFVLDTEDGAKESFSKDQIQSYLSNGVEINGVTEESLSMNDLTTTIIDFPSRGAMCGQVFNGYYFESYDEESYLYYHNPYLFSIIPADKCNVFDILNYLQDANTSVFNKIVNSFQKSSMGYHFDCSFDNGLFNVKEMSTGAEYGFSYSDVCSSLVNDKLYVEGLENITKDSVKIFSNYYSIEDSIKYNLQDVAESATFFCDSIDCPEGCIDYVDVSSDGLTNFINQNRDKKLSKSQFPMVNLFEYATRGSVLDDSKANDFINKLNYIKSSQFVKREGSKFIFSDIEVDEEDAILVHNLFKLSNPDFYNEVEKYLEFKEARNKLLLGEDSDKVIERGFRINDSNEPVISMLRKSVHSDCYETEFGNLISLTYIREREFDNEAEKRSDFNNTDGLSIFSVTKTAVYYYRFSIGGITISLGGNNIKKKAKAILNNHFTKYLDYFRNDLGYYFDRPNIVPLMVHSVTEHDDGIEINVVVALNTNDCRAFNVPFKGDKENDKRDGWGIQYLVVPLMFTGTSHYFTDDYVVFEMLFQDFIMSKSVYNNMVAKVDEFNDLIYMDGCTPATSSKLDFCYPTTRDTKNIKTFKRYAYGDIRKFNKMLEGEYLLK